MLIRKAKLKDVPQIVELSLELLNNHAQWDSFYTPAKNVKSVYQKFFKSCIFSKNRQLLVAVQWDEIVAYAMGKIEKRPPVFKYRNLGMINEIFVKKPFRKQGLAKLFLDELFKWFKEKKVDGVELRVHAKNEIGKKAWANYGFEPYMYTQRIRLK